jgi:hypothetical protein
MRFPNPFSALRALKRVLCALLKGKNPLVDAETLERRLSLCETCVHFDKYVRQCNVCACQVDLKIQFKTEKCPLGYWKSVRLTPAALLRLFFKTCHFLRKILR